MVRSVIREDQVLDIDFISNTEHYDPLEVPHTFLMCVDTPATYSGSKNKILLVNDDELGINFIDNTHTEADILDLDKYTKTEVDNKLLTLSGSIILDHGNLTGLADDDHPQYHDDMRGDARYYTETELNNGQLDNRYYTEAEINSRMVTISGAIGIVSSTYSSSEEETSISATTTPVQKLRLVTPTLDVESSHRLQYYCEVKCSASNKDIVVRIQIDDTNTILEAGKTTAAELRWDTMGGFYAGALSSGTHTVDLDFYSSTTGPHTLVIRRARLEFWRIQLWQ